MTEAEIFVEHREELAYLLTEAAEIEHGLMCCYLYAAYSLKAGERDGLTSEEATSVAEFRTVLLEVARDEMAHLALVSNVLTAIGSSPHFMRPNFPVATGYHPAGIVVSLAPLDMATLEHFIFLERPEGVELPDGAGFTSTRSYQRKPRRGRLMPHAQDYEAVGHLYRGIRQGLVSLADKLGEKTLFAGDPRLQVGPDIMPMRGLTTVTDLASAAHAMDTIVTQGEGSPTNPADSHYRRFVELRERYVALLARNPQFCPAHPVARNPLMRRPADPANCVWVSREPAATLLDLSNAVYAFMLRALDTLFSHVAHEGRARDALVDACLLSMRTLGPLASVLPTLAATDDDRGPRAGLTFTMSRSPLAPPGAFPAFLALAERAHMIGDALATTSAPHGSFESSAKAFSRVAENLSDVAARTRAHAPATVEPSAPPVATYPPERTLAPAAPPAKPSREVVEGKLVTLNFEAKRCIHSRHCVLGAPEVFLANVEGAWLRPDDAPLERLVGVAHACPSGAITYQRRDGRPQEEAPPVNVLRIRERGPLALHADLNIASAAPCYRATLCRCGASKNKPFCDGSHNALGFDATGEPATIPSEPLTARGGRLDVTPTKNGPLRVRGPLELCSGTGRTVKRVTFAMLCRCGGSKNKPFCDGTHAQNGFEADGDA